MPYNLTKKDQCWQPPQKKAHLYGFIVIKQNCYKENE